MKEIQYKDFSLRTHKNNYRNRKPNFCQFEMTFRCNLRCQHCYSDCYNKPEHIDRELTTDQIKYILDKVKDSGVLWLCLTGGDPLARPDFLEVYAYAKNKGFIVTLFTNGFSMTKKIADYLEKSPPFVIEVTLNAANQETYERISQVKGSFKKAIAGIRMIKSRDIPVNIKALVTKDNLEEMPRIKKFVIEDLKKGLRFTPQIFARLNHDLGPCNLRITPQEAWGLNNEYGLSKIQTESCLGTSLTEQELENHKYLFRCAAGGGDGFHIDPYGKMFFCTSIRRPAIDLLNGGSIHEGLFKLYPKIRMQEYQTDSRCRSCRLARFCLSCPGKAYLETGDLEAPVEWYCELTHLVTGLEEQRYNLEERG